MDNDIEVSTREEVEATQARQEVEQTLELVPTSISNSDSPLSNNAIQNEQSTLKTIIQRDSNNLLRKYTADGVEIPPSAAEIKLRRMNLTQHSSMSLTQENSPTVYEQYDIRLQQDIRDDCPSTGEPYSTDIRQKVLTQDATTQQESLHSKQHTATTRTESTPHTFEEHEAGHVRLHFSPGTGPTIEAEVEDDESQDASSAPQLHSLGQAYEPQTPAPPINPFAHKGSVMKGHEMFGATQPSSIGRLITSPTSSRPSPDVYKDFSSPPKRTKMSMLSSPLGPLGGGIETPLQSSVRNILAQSTDFSQHFPRTSGVQSFNIGPRTRSTQALHEPRPYVSMQESQERRSRHNGGTQGASSSDSDSDIEAKPRNRRKQMDTRIQKELSAVALKSKETPKMPRSGRSGSSGSPSVEVPSTGRRRSVQEEYLAQCEGSDARDTQVTQNEIQMQVDHNNTPQDDFVADSQAVPEKDPEEQFALEPPNRGHSVSIHLAAEQESVLNSESNKIAAQINNMQAPSESVAERPEVITSAAKLLSSLPNSDPNPETPESDLPHSIRATELLGSSLPLQGVSSNLSTLQTPKASRVQLEVAANETVPETSPPEQRLHPMGDLAISFGGNDNEFLDDVPGFTQDLEFDKAMGMKSVSPEKFPKLRTRKETLSPHAEQDEKNKPDDTSVSKAMSSLEAPNPSTGATGHKSTGVGNQNDAETNHAPVMSNAKPSIKNGKNSKHMALPGSANKQDESRTTSDDATPGNQENIPKSPELPPPIKRGGLRTKSKLKGPSAALRRTETPSSIVTPQPVTKVSKTYSKKGSGPRVFKHLSTTATPSTSRSTSTRSLGAIPKPQQITPVVRTDEDSAFAPLPSKRTSKRKSAVTALDKDIQQHVPKRSSKRQSTASYREESSDLLILPSPSVRHISITKVSNLFDRMSFAVSYVKQEQERENVTKLIEDHGGTILAGGFDSLFEPLAKSSNEVLELSLSPAAQVIGFTALIADEHSRKAKYMQALALGLPCISGCWITACVAKSTVLDWAPYLLCAGQSSFLGNAIRSRTLQPYPASEATLADTFERRDKLLDGKSILLVTGKGKVEEKRKAYVFLARALGPARVKQVVDYGEARKRLLEAESDSDAVEWDLLYVDANAEAADTAVFGSGKSNGSKKRKRGSEESTPAPKRIRIISDETMVQSLILGKVLEEVVD